MRVFFYIAHLGSGGSERVCVNMANELIHRGHEVHIITLNLEKNAYAHILSPDCILHSLRVSRIRYSMFPFLKAVRQLKPEKIIVFSHELLVWVNYLKKLHLIHTEIILRNQNNLEAAYTEKTEISPVVQRVLKATCKVIRNTDHIIAQCDAMKTQLVETYQIPEEQITVIYNPVSREVTLSAMKLRMEKTKGHHIVTIGRLETQKNMEHLIRAFHGLRHMDGFQDSTLEIVGEGYERPVLDKLIAELDLKSAVTMNGIRKDIENVYCSADVVALSSNYEGMPNVLIEAISIGIPVVSYDCPVGPREIIIPDKNGYLAQNGDIQSLTDCLRKALSKNWNPDEIRRTADKFGVEKAIDELLPILGKEEHSIAFYLGSLAKGGAERVAVNVAEYLANQKWTVTIITKLQAEEEYSISDRITRKIADIEGNEISHSRLRNLHSRVLKLRKIFRETSPDIILSFIGKNNFMAIRAARPLHIPVVVSVRSAPTREYGSTSMKVMVKPMFQKAAGVILQTQDAMNYFPKRIQKKAIILPNSLKPVFLNREVVKDREQKIVTVGRLDDNKNQILLIHAFDKIAGEFPKVELFLYGDGPSRNKWENECKNSQYCDRIHFEGVCDDIPDRISNARVFVLPSRMEGMPNALIEAMALGLAVVSTDCPCGGPRELLGDNLNGLLISISTERENSGAAVNDMAEAIRRILTDSNLEIFLRECAHQKAQEFIPERVNGMWMNYLLTTMEKFRG